MTDKLDISLVQKFKTGDCSAFEQIVKRESPILYGVIRRYIRLEEKVDDVFQDTWLREWQKRSQIKDPGSFRAWMCQIARSIIFKQHKRSDWGVDVEFFGEWEDLTQIPDSEMDIREKTQLAERVGLLNEQVHKLDQASQEILAMSFGADLTLREISKVLNIKYGTVCSKMFRALKVLRTGLESKGIKSPF